MARKGILNTEPAGKPRPTREAPAPRGAVGALQSSLTKLQENAVQELDASTIHDAGVVDRLDTDLEADLRLQDSLREYGQQVPVLVRPRDGEPGQFDIVYGRRRLRALRQLGMPVKALVRQLDDKALVLAQGQENTARQDLSFIEKASFAAQLLDQNYDRETIAAALSMDLPMISRVLKVGRTFNLPFLQEIGSAPGIGRDRWLKLVAALEVPGAWGNVNSKMRGLMAIDSSDERFEQVLQWAEAKPTKSKPPARPSKLRKIKSVAGYEIARVKRGTNGLNVTIPDTDMPDFAYWVEDEAETVFKELYDRWLKTRSKD